MIYVAGEGACVYDRFFKLSNISLLNMILIIRIMLLFKYLMVALVQLIVTQMNVPLRYLDIAVSRKLLCQFEISRASQYASNEIMAERMRCDPAYSLLTKDLPDAFIHQVSGAGSCNGFNLLTCTFVMPCK